MKAKDIYIETQLKLKGSEKYIPSDVEAYLADLLNAEIGYEFVEETYKWLYRKIGLRGKRTFVEHMANSTSNDCALLALSVIVLLDEGKSKKEIREMILSKFEEE